ncbi:MAG: hypothetical protein K6T83_18320, partial [Alicyclobacillus sp.]|nr:hypothetical protein [Alicyclobacillus sp.]
MGRRKRLVSGVCLVVAGLSGFVGSIPNAHAASYGEIVMLNGRYYPTGGLVGTFAIAGSDTFQAKVNGGQTYYAQWENQDFYGTPLYVAPVQFENMITDATIASGVLQADIADQNSFDNGGGFLLLPESEVAQVANALGGNVNYVESQVDQYAFSINGAYYVPLPLVVNESGGEMTNNYVYGTGQYYTKPPFQNDQIVDSVFQATPSNPPIAESLTAQVQGTSVTLNFTVNVPLFA